MERRKSGQPARQRETMNRKYEKYTLYIYNMRRLQTKCVCLLLTLATLAVPQALLVATEWKVESTTQEGSTRFTVTRSGDVSKPAEVYYRTISLSAMAD